MVVHLLLGLAEFKIWKTFIFSGTNTSNSSVCALFSYNATLFTLVLINLMSYNTAMLYMVLRLMPLGN